MERWMSTTWLQEIEAHARKGHSSTKACIPELSSSSSSSSSSVFVLLDCTLRLLMHRSGEQLLPSCCAFASGSGCHEQHPRLHHYTMLMRAACPDAETNIQARLAQPATHHNTTVSALTLAQLAVNERSGRLQSLRGVLELAERLQLDHLKSTNQGVEQEHELRA
eukprot:1157229-Pelagomonas_calceolata.AAC.5